MKIAPRQTFLAGCFLLGLIAGCFSIQPALADPMTGGNPPYEDCAPPCGVSCYDPPPRCPWYFQADAVGLRRDPAGLTPFATIGTGPVTASNLALSTAEFDRQFKGGVQFLFGHTFGDSPFSVEGSYFWIDEWNSPAEFRDPTGNLYSPFSNFGLSAVPAGFDNNRFVSIRDRSRLQNGEANVKYLLPMPGNGFRASFLAGVRYISVQEDFHYQSSLTLLAPPTLDLTTHTVNDLIGPQIGGYFEIFSVPNAWITFEMKGAICGNTAAQRSIGSPVGNSTLGADRVTTAFVGDLELMLNWQITSHCITRFGYQAMWVDGLALATRNFGPDSGILGTGVPAIDTDGSVVYHGPHLGVEITW